MELLLILYRDIEILAADGQRSARYDQLVFSDDPPFGLEGHDPLPSQSYKIIDFMQPNVKNSFFSEKSM